MQCSKFRLLAPILLVNLFHSGAITAQTFADNSARSAERIIQRQEQRTREQLRELQRQDKSKIIVEPEQEATPEDSEQCFEIDEIIIEGAESMGESVKNNFKKPYINQCIKLEQIDLLSKMITNWYIDKGHVTTRAYIPAQDLSDRTLELVVVESRIGRIIPGDNSGLSELELDGAFPVDSGDRLNIRDLEQGLDQLNRLQSNDAKLKLQPGKSVGESDVLVENQPGKWWRANAQASNFGSQDTGEKEGLLSISTDSFFGFNEFLSLSHTRDLSSPSNEFARSTSFFSSFPVGNLTFSMFYNRFKYQSVIANQPLVTNQIFSSGNSDLFEPTVNWVAYRGKDSITNLNASLRIRENEGFINGVLVDSSSYNLTVLSLKVLQTSRFLGGALDFAASYDIGLDFANATDDSEQPANLDGPPPNAQFAKATGKLSYAKFFNLGDANFRWNSSVQGQWADSRLYAAEKISVGGQYTVRGFKEELISGDEGFFFRNEVSYYVPQQFLGILTKYVGVVDVYAGYDYGQIKTNSIDARERGVLQGIGFGMRSSGAPIQFSLDLSKGIARPAFLEKENWVGLFSLSAVY